MTYTMTHTIGGESIEIILTTDELQQLQRCHTFIWATPVNSDKPRQPASIYLASQAQWKYDYIIASSQDAYDVLGYWLDDELDEEEAAEEVVLIVPANGNREEE